MILHSGGERRVAQTVILVGSLQEGAGGGGLILLQSNGRVFVQFTELTRRYTSSHRLVLVVLPPSSLSTQYFFFFWGVGRVRRGLPASSSVREPPRHTAPITLSCHADRLLVAHARGKVTPACCPKLSPRSDIQNIAERQRGTELPQGCVHDTIRF